MANLTNRLLQRAARIAGEMSIVQSALTVAFVARYGVTYSDVDADGIIDILDYQGGHITLADCDRIMTDTGHPPLKEA